MTTVSARKDAFGRWYVTDGMSSLDQRFDTEAEARRVAAAFNLQRAMDYYAGTFPDGLSMSDKREAKLADSLAELLEKTRA